MIHRRPSTVPSPLQQEFERLSARVVENLEFWIAITGVVAGIVTFVISDLGLYSGSRVPALIPAVSM